MGWLATQDDESAGRPDFHMFIVTALKPCAAVN